MTKKFDENARQNLLSQKKLFNPLLCEADAKPNQMVVKKVPASSVREYIASFHYSHIMPDNAFECYAGYYGDSLAGVVVFGNGASNEAFKALIPFIEVTNCRELMRLWSPDGMPANTESKLISESIKLLPKEVYLILSFADPNQNHKGIIYQACNFHYCGMSNPSKMLIDDKGCIFHVRTIGSFKRRHPELRSMTHKEIMAKYNWKYIDASGKHRYVLFRGEKWLQKLMYYRIQHHIEEYP